MNANERAAIEALTDENAHTAKIIQIVRPRLEPAWSFFVALCHALHEGENKLTAKDAYWLGLIDEVLGDPDMAVLRLISEYRDDPPPPPPAQQQQSTGNQNAQDGKEKTAQEAADTAGAKA